MLWNPPPIPPQPGDDSAPRIKEKPAAAGRSIEILWLIYKLEAEAAKAGGGVHLVLGNHEAMVLSGDLLCVHGGISRDVVERKLTLQQLNAAVRDKLSGTTSGLPIMEALRIDNGRFLRARIDGMLESLDIKSPAAVDDHVAPFSCGASP